MVKSFCKKEDYSPLKKYGENYYEICIDPVSILEEGKDSGLCTYSSETIYSKPSDEYIKNVVLDYYNKKIDNNILSGFVWKEMPVWLSSENQFNYKAAYDLAVQTQGQSLPITFKFGTTLEPVYYTFETLEDFSDFYISAITYINNCLNNGWKEKDAINWDDYKVS